MKFNCGHWPDKKKRLENWHRFFAIFPRKVDAYDCRFLETIERSGRHYITPYSSGWHWQYRSVND